MKVDLLKILANILKENNFEPGKYQVYMAQDVSLVFSKKLSICSLEIDSDYNINIKENYAYSLTSLLKDIISGNVELIKVQPRFYFYLDKGLAFCKKQYDNDKADKANVQDGNFIPCDVYDDETVLKRDFLDYIEKNKFVILKAFINEKGIFKNYDKQIFLQ